MRKIALVFVACIVLASPAGASQMRGVWIAHSGSGLPVYGGSGSTPLEAATNAMPRVNPVSVCAIAPGTPGTLTAFYWLFAMDCSTAVWPVTPDYIYFVSLTDCSASGSNCPATDPNKNRGDQPCTEVGNPINAATGNKCQIETDFAMPSPNGMRIRRYYNSNSGFFTAMGSNWSSYYDRRILILSSTAIQLQRQDGSGAIFQSSSPYWTGDSDNKLLVQQNAGGGWTIITEDNSTESYDASGALQSILFSNGERHTLTYSTSSTPSNIAPGPGLLIAVMDLSGRQLSLAYDSHGRLASILTPDGGSYQYSFARQSGGSPPNITSVTYPDGSTRQYLYNEPTYTSGAQLPLALTGIVDEKGVRFATFGYDSSGRAISTTHALGADAYTVTYNANGTSSVTDPLQTSRAYSFTNAVGVLHLGSISSPCTDCGTVNTQARAFDSNGNLTSATDYDGNLTCRVYDTSRNLLLSQTAGLGSTGTCSNQIVLPESRKTTTSWNPLWRLPAQVAEPLRITTYHYNGDPGVSCAPTGAPTTLLCSVVVQGTMDGAGFQGLSATTDGSPARTTSFTYDAVGRLAKRTGPRTDLSDVTTYAYYSTNDPSGAYKAGDLGSITDAALHTTLILAYDGAGRVKKIVDPNGLETLTTYWPRGWIKSRQLGIAAQHYETTQFNYFATGLLQQVIRPDQSFVTYSYDDAHRLVGMSDGLSNRVQYSLDALGNQTGQLDTTGNRVRGGVEYYDPTGRLVRAANRSMDNLNRVAADIGGTDPIHQVTRYSYDANGNAKTIVDPFGRTTTRAFDALNRLHSILDPNNGTTTVTNNARDKLTQVTDAQGLTTTYSVNGYDETITLNSPDSGTTQYTYDASSNLKTKRDGRGILASYMYDAANRLSQITYPDETVAYTYDSCQNGINRLCSIGDKTGTTSYTYDLWGRVTSKAQLVGGLSQTIAYGYNSVGQLVSTTTPSGKQVAYTYTNNRPVSVSIDQQTVLASAVYEPFGPVGGWLWGNSTQAVPNTHTRLFDLDFRPTRMTSDLPVTSGNPYFDREATWDIQSRIGSITDHANASFSAFYGYDSLDHLSQVSQGASTWTYGYTGAGDRNTSTVNGATSTYSYYPGTHQLQSVTGAQSRNLTYDLAGNIATDGTTTWTFGGNNRPAQVGTIAVSINAIGQRVRKSTTAGATRFIYDEQGHLWGEYDDSGNRIAETVWLEDLPVAVIK